jgi:hypothetical protein
MNMQQFEITLKNEKYRLYDRLAVFIFLLNAIGIIFTFFLKGQSSIVNRTGAFTLLLLVAAILVHLNKSVNIKKEYYFFFAVLFASLYWILQHVWWLSVLLIVLAILYTFSKKKPVVHVSSQRITYPSFPVRSIQWQQLNNLIIKEGLLTIDFKNNKFIQQAIEENNNYINEQDFNDFCRQQLKSSVAKKNGSPV